MERSAESPPTARIAEILTWLTRWFQAIPKGKRAIEGADQGTIVTAAAWSVFIAWRYCPGDPRPLLL